MHFLAGHGAQIDKKPELIFGVELVQSHMLGFVFFFHKEAADLSPRVVDKTLTPSPWTTLMDYPNGPP